MFNVLSLCSSCCGYCENGLLCGEITEMNNIDFGGNFSSFDRTMQDVVYKLVPHLQQRGKLFCLSQAHTFLNVCQMTFVL